MAGYLVTSSLHEALEAFLTAENYSVALFVNDIFPSPRLLLSAIVEMSLTGYARQVINAADWTFTDATDGASANAESPELTFVPEGGIGPNHYYGYFVLAEDGSLKWAERFSDAPRSLSFGANTVQLTLSMTDFNGVIG